MANQLFWFQLFIFLNFPPFHHYFTATLYYLLLHTVLLQSPASTPRSLLLSSHTISVTLSVTSSPLVSYCSPHLIQISNLLRYQEFSFFRNGLLHSSVLSSASKPHYSSKLDFSTVTSSAPRQNTGVTKSWRPVPAAKSQILSFMFRLLWNYTRDS